MSAALAASRRAKRRGHSVLTQVDRSRKPNLRNDGCFIDRCSDGMHIVGLKIVE